MDRDDLELFERTLGSIVETRTGAELDASLVELGWRDAARAEPRVAISMLFDRQGRAVAVSSALDTVVIDALGLSTDDAAVVLPALGGYGPPGSLDAGVVTVAGLASSASAGATTLLVVVARGEATLVTSVRTDELVCRRVRGIDPDAGIAEITGSAHGDVIGPIEWPVVLRLARLACAHELVGASRQMLELARQHALDRVQFGVPIASFQAVRHRLAEALVAIEMADAALDSAWLDDAAHHAVIAKALAGRGARTVARHAQQVLAGIGYTTEHPFHRYFRRVLLLDELFGSARLLTKELGDHLLSTRTLPPVLPL